MFPDNYICTQPIGPLEVAVQVFCSNVAESIKEEPRLAS